MKLTGRQIREIREALLDAFPTKASLRMMVRIELDANLDVIAGGENLRIIVFNLVDWSVSHGRVADLIEAAYRENPSNPLLRQLRQESLTWKATWETTPELAPNASTEDDHFAATTEKVQSDSLNTARPTRPVLVVPLILTLIIAASISILLVYRGSISWRQQEPQGRIGTVISDRTAPDKPMQALATGTDISKTPDPAIPALAETENTREPASIQAQFSTPLSDDKSITPSLVIKVAGSGSDLVHTIAFSPDATEFAYGGKDSIVHVMATSDGQEIVSLSGHTDTIAGVAWSPDGQQLVSGSKDHTVQIWDVAAAQPAIPPLTGHSAPLFDTSWSAGGQWIASGGKDRQVTVWNAVDGSLISSTNIGADAIGVAWSPDSDLLAVSSVGEVKILDPSRDLEIIGRLAIEGGDSWDVAWSADGRFLAAAGHDNNVHLWQVDHWDSKRVLEGHQDTVTSIAWSPSSFRLASTAYDGTVRIWDARSGLELLPKLATPEGGGGILTVDWSDDGGKLAASGSGVIWIWDVAQFETDLPK